MTHVSNARECDNEAMIDNTWKSRWPASLVGGSANHKMRKIRGKYVRCKTTLQSFFTFRTDISLSLSHTRAFWDFQIFGIPLCKRVFAKWIHHLRDSWVASPSPLDHEETRREKFSKYFRILTAEITAHYIISLAATLSFNEKFYASSQPRYKNKMIYLSLIALAVCSLANARRQQNGSFPSAYVLRGKWLIFRGGKVREHHDPTLFLLLFRSTGVPDGATDRRTSSRLLGSRGLFRHREFLGTGHVDFRIDRDGVQE